MGELVNAKARPREEVYDLKSLPGGWVKIRRFNHGERIDRLSKVLVMSVEGDEEDASPEARINHLAARQHDFAHAILDHNLGDGNGYKYNFKKKEDVMAIDGEVGDEIDDLIQIHQAVIPDSEVPNSERSLSDSTSTQSNQAPDQESSETPADIQS